MKYGLLRKVSLNVLLIICLPATLLVTGCAANAKRMVPTDLEVVNRHKGTVSVNESIGGHETNPLWSSQISNSAFTEALSNALATSGVFSSVVKGNEADYSLIVAIADYDQPLFGIDFNVSMKTNWQLINNKTHAAVWTDSFKTTYKAKFGEALIGAERLQKANEGSVRVSIKEGIKRMSALSL